MKQRIKNKWEKALNASLDVLLFVVPLLEVTEVIHFIPPEYLPYYMLGALILRRTVRYLEEYMENRNAINLASDKE